MIPGFHFVCLLLALWVIEPDSSIKPPGRELILLAENLSDPTLLRQQVILKADPEGLTERELVVTVLTPQSNYQRYHQLKKNRKGVFVILIGKDGGEKLASEKPVTLVELYGLIDSMPIRKQEMRAKG